MEKLGLLSVLEAEEGSTLPPPLTFALTERDTMKLNWIKELQKKLEKFVRMSRSDSLS